MGFFNTLLGWFTTSSADYSIESSVNSENGLSMMGSIGGGDVVGDLFDTDFSDSLHDSTSMLVNPASGLPMMDGMGGVDVAGNPFGTDLSDSFSDPFDSFGSMGGFNDDF